MEEHIFTCLFPISIFLDIKDMKTLACVNKQLSIAMNAIMEDGALWRYKVENILCITVPVNMYKMDWKHAYDILATNDNDIDKLLYSDDDNCVNLALFLGADPCPKNYEVFISACSNGRLAIVDRLKQDPRTNIIAEENAAFQGACENGHLPVIGRILQDKIIDPSYPENFAFQAACRSGHLDIVNSLLQYNKVDPSANKCASFTSACRKGYLSIVERLLQDNRVDPSVCTDNDNAIIISCLYGHSLIVEGIFQDGRIDLNIIDVGAFIYSCLNGRLNVVDVLLQNETMNNILDEHNICKGAMLLGLKRNVSQLIGERILSEYNVSHIDRHLNIVIRLLNCKSFNLDDNLVCLNSRNDETKAILDRIIQDKIIDPDGVAADFVYLCEATSIIKRNFEHKRIVVDIDQIANDVHCDQVFNTQQSCVSGYLSVLDGLFEDQRITGTLTTAELSICRSLLL